VGGLDWNVQKAFSWLKTLTDAEKADGLYIRRDFVKMFLQHLFGTSPGNNSASTRLVSCIQVTSHAYIVTGKYTNRWFLIIGAGYTYHADSL